jgi:pectin methylesterase-like acyl-CoA thioesterase
MKTLRRLSIPVLLGVLLIATLVGVASARPNVRPQEQAWMVLTVPASNIHPALGATNYTNLGQYFETAGSSWYQAPVNFPAAGEQAVGAVNVKRLTLYAQDNSAADVCVYLSKSYPPTQAEAWMAFVCSSDAAPGTRSFTDTSIVANPVYRTQGAYLEISLNAGPQINGFFIHYTW